MEKDRVYKDVLRWETSEKERESLFKKGPNFYYQKLYYLEKVKQKYSRTENLAEIMTLNMVSDKIDELKKLIYPSTVWGWLSKGLEGLMRREDQRKEIRKELLAEHQQEIQSKMDISSPVKRMPRRAQKETAKETPRKIEVSDTYHTLDQETINLYTVYEKDEQEKYVKSGVRAEYFRKDRDELPVRAFFGPEAALNTMEIQTIMAGKSIERYGGSWMKLDLNDKDADGNCKLKVVPLEQGFSLKDALEKFPVKIDVEKASKFLRQGINYPFFKIEEGVVKNYSLSVDADKGLQLMDYTGKKTPMSTLTKDKTIDDAKLSAAVEKVLEHKNVRKLTV
ncbi:hypothetical protein [Olivibacter domesticus]|uniref:DUF3945 domain-containing protein n=1 Tax=Olivibacter domesticus TaxID=407022 RepID=A0A1H7I826_OLID1|nr:hypothetical protein [Olivibacter domesticus]SEK58578.1 hypothetical protein SAMN05661044_00613 [Olivibacter domesticus]